ncbi:MAG: hypothetical protein WBD34_20555 [Burkholderiaceae bacterium]
MLDGQAQQTSVANTADDQPIIPVDSNLFADLIGLVDFGIVVTAPEGNLTYLNPVAAQQLGVVAADVTGKMLSELGRNQAEESEWRRLLDGVARGGAGLFDLHLSDRWFAVAASTCANGTILIRFERPGELSAAARQFLSRQYRLTPAELIVVDGLLRGISPRGIAKEKGVAESTVRTQIKHALSKTRARGISELILKITRLPPG